MSLRGPALIVREALVRLRWFGRSQTRPDRLASSHFDVEANHFGLLQALPQRPQFRVQWFAQRLYANEAVGGMKYN